MLKQRPNVALSLMFLAMPVLAGTPISENELFKAAASEGKPCAPLVKRNESLCGGTFSEIEEGCPKDPQHRYIQPGEKYEVALRQTFVNKFSDLSFFGSKKGEIAIVANVVPIEAKTPVMFDSAAWKKARVVYYSPKVGEGHFLSMDNLLIFGPTTYQDQSLLVQFYMLELDEQNKGQQQLIAQLAELGKAYVSAPAPVVNVLSSLAKSLIGQNHDDLEIKYETRLSAPLRDSAGKLLSTDQQGLALQFGYYVLAQQYRKDLREESANFPKTPYFSYKDARIYADCGCTQELRTHNYLVFEVKKNPQATPVGSFEVFDELMKRLTAEVETSSNNIAETLKTLASEQEILGAYSNAVQVLDAVESQRWNAPKTAGKRLKAEAAPLTPTLKAQMKDSLGLLETSIAKQKKNEAPNLEAPFTRKQSQFLLTRLIQVGGDEAVPWTLGEAKLIDGIKSFFGL